MSDTAFTLLRLLAAIDAGAEPRAALSDFATADETRRAISCAQDRGLISPGTKVHVTPTGYRWAFDLLSPLDRLSSPVPRVHGRPPARPVDVS